MRIEQGARIIVENWLHAQPDDVLHLITDETRQRESEAFFHAARQIGAIPKPGRANPLNETAPKVRCS